jgi:hypothetical protein
MNKRWGLVMIVVLACLWNQMQESEAYMPGLVLATAGLILLAKLFQQVQYNPVPYYPQSYGGGQQQQQSYGGGSQGGYSGKRSVDDGVEDPIALINVKEFEKTLSLVYKYDPKLCVSRLICELHATEDRASFGNLEKGLIRFFQAYDAAKPGTAAYFYQRAANLGQSTNSEECAKVFSSCQLSAPQLMGFVKLAQ